MLKNGKKIKVIGVGNLLLGDEGVGIHAVNELKKTSFGLDVEIIDGGTAGIDLLFVLEGAGCVIIIDCLEAGTEPGTLFRVPAEEIITGPSREKYSLHDIDLAEVLSLADRLGVLPATIIYGVQPGEISFKLELTPEVQKALPRLVQLIEKEILSYAHPD